MKPTTKEIYMYALGALVVLGSFAITAVLVFVPISQTAHDIIMIAIGQLLGACLVVINYFFGSSLSSSMKTGALTDIVNKVTGSAPADVQK